MNDGSGWRRPRRRRRGEETLVDVLDRRVAAAGPVDGSLIDELAIALGVADVEALDAAIRAQPDD